MSLLRSTFTVGGLTAVSRVLGFVRDILIARALGSGPIADVFFVAFRFPNLFRRFFAEGAFNAAFVPLLARELEGSGRDAARLFAEEAMAGLVFVLLVLSALAMIFMPALMLIMAPGFLADPEKFDLAVLLTRITFPYLLFMSVVALLTGILNTLGRFTLGAAAPVVLNVVLISVLLFAVPRFPTAGHALAWGVTAAGVAQLLFLIWGCRRQNLLPRLRLPRWTPKMKRLVALGVPGLVAGGITQINIVIGSFIASLEAGAVSLLYYADRVYQLPLGMIGIAMGVVLLPELARRLRGGDDGGAMHSFNRALELSMLLTLPAAVALMVIPQPITQVLFERGAFTATDTRGVSLALMAFAAGLPAFVLIKVFQPGFFAREDTKTPMYYAGIQTAVNVALSLALFFWIGFVGIAIATSVAAWCNAGLLAWRLNTLGYFKVDERSRRRLPRILLTSLLMGVALGVGGWLLAPAFAAGFALQVTALIGLVLGGMVVFAGLAHVTGAGRLGELRAALIRR
jgi:putative peptidoglycan lipid II flippase